MPKKKWVELHTEVVMMAAEKLFEKKGYDATSVDDIAYESSICKSTLYVYFDSKEKIWDTLMCRYMEYLLADARKLDPGKIADDPLFFIRKRTFHRLDGELHAVFRMFGIMTGDVIQDFFFHTWHDACDGDDLFKFIIDPELHHSIKSVFTAEDNMDRFAV